MGVDFTSCLVWSPSTRQWGAAVLFGGDKTPRAHELYSLNSGIEQGNGCI